MPRRSVLLAILAACAHTAAPAAPAPANTGGHPPVPDDPFAPEKLDGPYGSLADFCARVDATADTEDGETVNCVPTPGGPKGGPTQLADAGPFRTVVVFPTYRQDTAPSTGCNLAVEDGDGWYVDADAFPCHVVHESGLEDTSIAKLDVEPLVGDHDLVVRLSDDYEMESIDDHKHVSYYPRIDEYLLVCSIGPSGVPSCTPEIPTVTHNLGDEKVVIGMTAERGAVVLTVPKDALEDSDIPETWRPLAGRHPLVFP